MKSEFIAWNVENECVKTVNVKVTSEIKHTKYTEYMESLQWLYWKAAMKA